MQGRSLIENPQIVPFVNRHKAVSPVNINMLRKAEFLGNGFKSGFRLPAVRVVQRKKN